MAPFTQSALAIYQTQLYPTRSKLRCGSHYSTAEARRRLSSKIGVLNVMDDHEALAMIIQVENYENSHDPCNPLSTYTLIRHSRESATIIDGDGT